MARENDDMRLACGRALTSSYTIVNEWSFNWPTCIACFGSDPILDREPGQAAMDSPSRAEEAHS
eukprot:1024685-Amphidinium_carterae.1